MKSQGKLFHLNAELFKMLTLIDGSFQEHMKSPDVFNLVTNEICDYTNYISPCTDHQDEIKSIIINYYLSMRMKQNI